jgi:hypothetical protein
VSNDELKAEVVRLTEALAESERRRDIAMNGLRGIAYRLPADSKHFAWALEHGCGCVVCVARKTLATLNDLAAPSPVPPDLIRHCIVCGGTVITRMHLPTCADCSPRSR